MSSPIQISDDDESFDQVDCDNRQTTRDIQEMVDISSDDGTDCEISDDDALPAVNLRGPREISRSAVIRNIFPTKPQSNAIGNAPSTSTRVPEHVATSSGLAPQRTEPKIAGTVRSIGGVPVRMPVEPYGCQVALMAKVITAIKQRKNCLLESPTGSGKTLALLCGALAWQQHETDTIAQSQAQQLVQQHPELHQVSGAATYIASPPNKQFTPEKLFANTVFGERSIYDKPHHNSDGTNKRPEPLNDPDCSGGSSYNDEVKIHKRRRLNGSGDGSNTNSPSKLAADTTPQKLVAVTPEKTINPVDAGTPPNVRALYHLVDQLQLRTSMTVNCRVPIIYYGARTHKQLQQVIKEFSRTAYCGSAKMSILSSRDYSCIREFDRNLWTSKNDMCRGCIKGEVPLTDNSSMQTSARKKGESNCKYFDNKLALTHDQLGPAFDLEDLLAAGREKDACPYYAARAMAMNAQIVFCPYNYLIEPSIRSAMQIDLKDNILIIDEAHNIEDICRDAASFTITQENIQACILELEIATKYRYANQDAMSYFDYLLNALKNWDQWFVNQQPWVINKPVNFNEAVHTWEVEEFTQTLNHHNIGEKQYPEFTNAAEVLCRRLRENPQALKGVTQTTGTLIESLDTVLGYVFREQGKYKDDFKPALVRTVQGKTERHDARAGLWRTSEFNNSNRRGWVEKASLSLRLVCLNPGIVFAGLKSARCIVLSSGTLTPLISLHSELDTHFPLCVSPKHVIPQDRIWIGTLTTCPDGQPLECTNNRTRLPALQDALGASILWVSQVTPHGVLCFLPSYQLMTTLHTRWQETGLWRKLCDIKHVFMESRNVRDHNDNMDDYYKYVGTSKGALLFAVYRGKVSEGMDFKDHQARAVITVGVPFPNMFDMSVKEKMKYNDKYSSTRGLLSSREWLRVQAYRALNQAVGRCVRHRNDWGAVLLADSRFANPYYTEHLSKWVRSFLGTNHHTYESLVNSPNSLESFMQNMTIRENEEEQG
ncbi:Fanconi anemia group J protein homolog isoform X2 [Pectinophora gossypiella]|uniref:Fanconi anemia group J protein homolog isoform X2 n=1 Tax=Pectinophora gossypiella TaxID=13191 RepID=UPI00214F29BD|nr:Fanconi anemia group J protein homolog isoform X2 [Pectinophora gossypiella]